MRNKWKPVDFDTLYGEHSFSAEEYDLLMQRINEELEDAPIDLIRNWKRQPERARNALGRYL
jgi:hypothetical protein